MRIRLGVAVLFCVVSMTGVAAHAGDRSSALRTIDVLEEKAAHAGAREQCFFFAELVHALVEQSASEYAAGDVDGATGALRRVQALADKIRAQVDSKDKRLKPAQILLRRAGYRLKELLRESSPDDRTVVEQTLARLDQAEQGTLDRIFLK